MLNRATSQLWYRAGVQLVARLVRDGVEVPAEFVEEVETVRIWALKGAQVRKLDVSAVEWHVPVMDPLLLTQSQVAEVLAISETAVKDAVRDGRLRVVRPSPGSRRFHRADVEAFAASLREGEVVTKAAVPGGCGPSSGRAVPAALSPAGRRSAPSVVGEAPARGRQNGGTRR